MHWTYNAVGADDDLQQGDILQPTEKLSKLFRQIHSHFDNPKYVGFIILTQSCDLVRRNGSCSTRHINVSVIRQLDGVLNALLDAVCQPVAEGIYLAETKPKAQMLLSRIFNQNEQSLGLFYLHPDADLGLAEPCVALLRVGVAFRSEHYETIREARCGRLQPEFRNKLGWLVGNIYSRVGTPDWSEQPDGRKYIDGVAATLLKEHTDWISADAANAARDAGVDLSGGTTRESILDELRKYEPPPLADRVLECVREVVADVYKGDDRVDKVINRLRNDPAFAQAMRRARR